MRGHRWAMWWVVPLLSACNVGFTADSKRYACVDDLSCGSGFVCVEALCVDARLGASDSGSPGGGASGGAAGGMSQGGGASGGGAAGGATGGGASGGEAGGAAGGMSGGASGGGAAGGLSGGGTAGGVDAGGGTAGGVDAGGGTADGGNGGGGGPGGGTAGGNMGGSGAGGAGGGRDGGAGADAGVDSGVIDAGTPCTTVPTITTNSLMATGFCPGSSIQVGFTVSGCVNASNVFVAQLSNAAGSFSQVQTIGNVAGTGTGTIAAILPAGTVAGSTYRVRVISTSPFAQGMDNGNDLTVHSLPNANFTFTPSLVLANGSLVTFTPQNPSLTSYSWSLGVGAVPAMSTAISPTASYTAPGVKVISLTATNSNGCSSIVTKGNVMFPFPGDLEVLSCTPQIPPGATVITTVGSGSVSWVCGGGVSINGGGLTTVFVEPGGTFNFTGGGQYTTYVRAGGVYSGGSGGLSRVVSEPGASISGTVGISLQCTTLTFDRSAFGPGGCP